MRRVGLFALILLAVFALVALRAFSDNSASRVELEQKVRGQELVVYFHLELEEQECFSYSSVRLIWHSDNRQQVKQSVLIAVFQYLDQAGRLFADCSDGSQLRGAINRVDYLGDFRPGLDFVLNNPISLDSAELVKTINGIFAQHPEIVGYGLRAEVY